MRVFCWAWLGRWEAKDLPTFLTHWAVHVGTLEFQYHLSTPRYETLLSANPFNRLLRLLNWHTLLLSTTLSWAQLSRKRPWISGVATKSTCVSDLGAKKNPINKQYWSRRGAHHIVYLEVHFCKFLRHPRSYTSELATAVITSINLGCAAKKHQTSKMFGFGVFVLVNASATNSSAIAQTNPLWEKWSAHPVAKEISAKIGALKFVDMTLRKLWLSSLWWVAEWNLS